MPASVSKAYLVYVLVLMLLAYILNQLDRYALATTSRAMAREIKFGDQSCYPLDSSLGSNISDVCRYKDSSKVELSDRTTCLKKRSSSGDLLCQFNYDGSGFQYQILAGPVFIIVYTLMGVPLGTLAAFASRPMLLSFCLIIWSTMTFLTGFATQYWHLVVTRFILGIAQAGCTPYVVSILTDYYPENIRGVALSIYNWGIYVGYSLAYTLGNFITTADINHQGWRWVYFLSGAPGAVIGLLILLTVRDPSENGSSLVDSSPISMRKRFKTTMVVFCGPATVMLFLAGAVRNGGGYVWAYNTQPYFNRYFPDVNVGAYMSWIPIVGGILGTTLGGLVSDYLISRLGWLGRVLVLVLSQLLATPFIAGTLFLKPPLALLSLIPGYIFGEMWVGVTMAVVVYLVPSYLRTSAIAWYLFVITMIGGNMQLIVPCLEPRYMDLRSSLYIMFPGMYLLSSLLFLASIPVLKWQLSRPDLSATDPDEDHRPLLE